MSLLRLRVEGANRETKKMSNVPKMATTLEAGEIMSTHYLLVKVLGGKCSSCGSTEDLVIHHVDRNTKNGSKENLRIFCRKCHIQVGHGWGKGNKITVILEADNETWLRSKTRLKGDMSKLVNEAIKEKREREK